MDINYSGQGKEIISLKKVYDSESFFTDDYTDDILQSIHKQIHERADEFFVTDQFEESNRGNFHISYENLITVDSMKLEEFERIIKEQAFLHDLVLMREEMSDGGFTIHWYPKPEENHD